MTQPQENDNAGPQPTVSALNGALKLKSTLRELGAESDALPAAEAEIKAVPLMPQTMNSPAWI
jgi:hypothetical protein